MDHIKPNNNQRVVIIGAGPAGLTTAYELSKLSITSTILEADNQVGGLSRTADYKGYRFDIGGHRFFSKVPYINQLWQEILDDDFLTRPRLSRIHYKGHFFDYPLKPFNALKGLGLTESILISLNYAKSKITPAKNIDNFEQWVINRFGSRLYNIFFKTYTEKVWGIPCREISSDWATQRIKNLSLREAVRNALLGNGNGKNTEVITTLIEQFHYPRWGPGMMWEHCQKRLEGLGSPTFLDTRIECIVHQDGRIVKVISRDSSGERKEISGDQFVSSMPLQQFIFALDPQPPNEVLNAAKSLRYRDYLTVVLIANRESVFPDNWIYIHTPEVMMGRIQNYKNWSPDMVPDQSKTSLGLEYFLWNTDEKWCWEDNQLIEMGIDECDHLEIIKPQDVEDGTVVRMDKAYPIYDHNYQNNLKIIRHFLTGLKNFQTIGRNGLHRYNNQDHSMLTGVYAARNLVGAKHDVWTVNTEQEYHEVGDAIETVVKDPLTPTRLEPSVERRPEPAADVIEILFSKLDPLALGTAIGIVSGLGLFLATAILLLRGGIIIGPTLSLLGHFLLGFKVGWQGAFLGMFEAGILGFILGNFLAWLRNFGMSITINKLRREAEMKEEEKLLEKV